MSIKKLVFRFFLLALLFQFTIGIFDFVSTGSNDLTVFMVAGGIALANLFLKNFMRFLNIERTFLTTFLATIVVTGAVCYFLDIFIPGFEVGGGRVESMNLGFIETNAFKVNEISAKILIAGVYAVFVSIADWLRKSSS